MYKLIICGDTYCNECQEYMEIGENVYGCRVCDFDLCHTCCDLPVEWKNTLNEFFNPMKKSKFKFNGEEIVECKKHFIVFEIFSEDEEEDDSQIAEHNKGDVIRRSSAELYCQQIIIDVSCLFLFLNITDKKIFTVK